jgi:NAD(P)-dependent dehydrogenase (short-subunit alcohol dehydrogenase family)
MTTGKSEFEGLTALVTGAAGGIGLAIAERLAQGGARIVACDRDQPRLEAAARGLAKDTVAVAGDIGSEDGVETLFARAIAQAGAIDILVNGAGIAEPIVRTVDQKLVDRVGRRNRRYSQFQRLRRIKSRHRSSHPDHGHRVGTQEHPGQLRRAWLH